MKLFKKTYWLIFPVLIVFFMIFIQKVLKIEEVWMNSALAVSLAFILSPRKKVIQTQTGEVEQITWLFFKKVINK